SKSGSTLAAKSFSWPANFAGQLKLFAASVLPDFDSLAFDVAYFSYELECGYTFELIIPVLIEDFELREVVDLPIDNCVVIFLRDGLCSVVGHRSSDFKVGVTEPAFSFQSSKRILSNARSNFKRPLDLLPKTGPSLKGLQRSVALHVFRHCSFACFSS